MKNTYKYINTLKEIANQQEDTIKKAVAIAIILQATTDEEIINFFKDLQTKGCYTGMVNSLKYYKDTKAFYKFYKKEIEEIRQTFIEKYNIEIEPKRMDTLAWFAFEIVADELANELEIEL